MLLPPRLEGSPLVSGFAVVATAVGAVVLLLGGSTVLTTTVVLPWVQVLAPVLLRGSTARWNGSTAGHSGSTAPPSGSTALCGAERG